MIYISAFFILLVACVYFVIRLDRRMKSQFGEDQMSAYELKDTLNQMVAEANSAADDDLIEDAPAAVGSTQAALTLAQLAAIKQAASAKELASTAAQQPELLVKRFSLFDADQLRFWHAVSEGLGNRWALFPNQRFQQLLETDGVSSEFRATELSDWVLDIVLCQPHTYAPVCACILIDETLEPRYQQLLEKLTAECESINLPLIKFIRSDAYSSLAVASRILKILGVQPLKKPEPLAVGRVADEEVADVLVVPVKSVKDAVENKTTTHEDIKKAELPAVEKPCCPLCKGEMLERKVKTGAHAGRLIWACKSYPTCKGVLVSRS